jgi:Zn-dependent alcohol dehydrogenase
MDASSDMRGSRAGSDFTQQGFELMHEGKSIRSVVVF